MKYNKSEIMRNAWAIRRAENKTMSEALRKAWAIAKATTNAEEKPAAPLKGSEKQIAWANDLRSNAVNVLEWMRKNPSNEAKKDLDMWEKGINFVESKLFAVEYASQMIDALRFINLAHDPEKIAVTVVRHIHKYC